MLPALDADPLGFRAAQSYIFDLSTNRQPAVTVIKCRSSPPEQSDHALLSVIGRLGEMQASLACTSIHSLGVKRLIALCRSIYHFYQLPHAGHFGLPGRHAFGELSVVIRPQDAIFP